MSDEQEAKVTKRPAGRNLTSQISEAVKGLQARSPSRTGLNSLYTLYREWGKRQQQRRDWPSTLSGLRADLANLDHVTYEQALVQLADPDGRTPDGAAKMLCIARNRADAYFFEQLETV